MKNPRVTFRLRPRETGLRVVCAGPRSSEIRTDGVTVGSVSPLRRNFTTVGWYWVLRPNAACDGSPHINSCDTPAKTEEAAKAEAKAWILSQIKEAK